MAKLVLGLFVIFLVVDAVFGRIVDKRKCPEVRAVPHFDLPQMLGDWYVVEYYASAEEALEYSCMRAVFAQDDHVPAADGSVEWTPGVTMNFTYRFADDPLGETLLGNITWKVDLNEPAHWTHAESTCDLIPTHTTNLVAVSTMLFAVEIEASSIVDTATEMVVWEYTYLNDGIYNTYVLDTEYKTWALLLHCAEQREGARYLSAFVLSRKTSLPKNVMAYLRDKLPRYDVDIQYVFPIPHTDCSNTTAMLPYGPLMVDADNKVRRPAQTSYKVAFGH